MIDLRVATSLTSDQARGVLDLVDTASAHDRVTPLSEHVLLHLRHGGDEHDVHVLANTADGRLVGYAHLDATDVVEGASGEVVVAPLARDNGIGTRLVEQLLELSPDGRLRLWSHGASSTASHLAESLGFTRVRTLWQMRRSLLAALPEPKWPVGIRLRNFEPGRDEAAWLEVNAAAFADLPDQGGWTSEDLRRRMQESWFDPWGFLIAETEDGGIAGFHWTKIHGSDGHEHGHGHEPIGEIYVIGVAPAWRGTGLGRALALAGMAHLRRAGLAQVMLYVDAENSRATGLYESLGFSRWDTDTLYRR
jgi:mycothiol synthase